MHTDVVHGVHNSFLNCTEYAAFSWLMAVNEAVVFWVKTAAEIT